MMTKDPLTLSYRATALVSRAWASLALSHSLLSEVVSQSQIITPFLLARATSEDLSEVGSGLETFGFIAGRLFASSEQAGSWAIRVGCRRWRGNI